VRLFVDVCVVVHLVEAAEPFAGAAPRLPGRDRRRLRAEPAGLPGADAGDGRLDLVVAHGRFFGTSGLQEAEVLCRKANLVRSLGMLSRLRILFAGSMTNSAVGEALGHFHGLLMDELAECRMFLAPKDRLSFHDNGRLFGAAVFDAFPSARMDIREAGNCWLFGRNNAVVYHLMCAAEFGLRALAADRHIELAQKPAVAHGLADAVREEPCGLQGDAQGPVELVAAHALLGGAEQRDRLEPQPQRDVAALEHGADLHGEGLAARVAVVDPDAGGLAAELLDAGADRAVRPELGLHPGVGGFLVVEPGIAQSPSKRFMSGPSALP
jgi:hypothetical protein